MTDKEDAERPRRPRPRPRPDHGRGQDEPEHIVIVEKTSPALIASVVVVSLIVLAMLIVFIVMRTQGPSGTGPQGIDPAGMSSAVPGDGTTPVGVPPGVDPADAVNKLAAGLGEATHPSGALYIGQSECVKCHKEEAAKMATVRMSSAIDRVTGSLDVPNAISEVNCVRCHSTGFGYARAEGVTAWDLVNVQCEACHGPGSEYIKLMKKKGFKAADKKLAAAAAAAGLVAKPTKEGACLNCHHDEPGQAPWDFESRREFIKHWD